MKRVSFIICLLLAGFLLYGQETDVDLPGGEFGGLNPKDDGVVGAIGGVVNVSAMGAATYTIPILVPEGINGIQPDLSIVYNSQKGNGLMGWGWDLSGLSAITRTGQCMFYDDTITSVDFDNDRFLLDGQRLMLVNEGPYGDNGAEYKTENDGMNKIVSYTCDTTRGPAMFKVWMANGNMAFYGSRQDSRIGLKKSHDVCLWLLDSVVDRNGNYMSYHYYRSNIMYYLDYIVYAGHHSEKVTVSPQYKIKFIYDQNERLDKEQCFVGNYSLRQLKLLKGIKVFHMPSGALQHQYDFEYDELGLSPNQYSCDLFSPPEFAYYYNRLKTIVFSKDNYHYNPTRIEWGENDYKVENYRQMTVDTSMSGGSGQSSYQFFNNRCKFPGDFNGDGLTDIAVFEYSTPDRAGIYINQGNYRNTAQNNIHTNLKFRRLHNSIQMNDNTDWIYVADFNGDGLDDMLCLSRDRNVLYQDKIYLTGYFARLDHGEVVFDSIPTEDSYYRIKKSYAEAILVGDFLGEGRCQFYMQTYDPSKREKNSEVAYLFKYKNGEFKKIPHVNNYYLQAEKFTAADFNGDGATEIIYSCPGAPNCEMVRLTKRDDENGFHYHTIANFGGGLTYQHKIFPGDFNGDGHADLLTYLPGSNGNDGTWQIRLFKGDALESTCYSISANDIVIDDPGNHNFSLHDQSNPDFVFFEVADMNGDGKSDIVLNCRHGGANHIRVLFAPIRRVNGTTRFADIQEWPRYNNNQTDCVGNFYGTETACIALTTIAWSCVPISNRYGVKSITDGMGNRTSFTYGYLTHNPMQNNNIYTLYNPGTNLGNDIYHIALPMKAVKEIKVDHAFNNTVPAVKTQHSYINAFAHRKGRGFLGFERTIVEKVIGSTTRCTTISDNEIESMGNTCLAMPSTTTVYDGNDYLLSETEYTFQKYSCFRDPKHKVFIVKPKKQITDDYEILGDRNFLRRRISEFTYCNSYSNGNAHYYHNDVLTKEAFVGTDGSMVDFIQDCEYLTTTTTTYRPDDITHWVLGRPNHVMTTMRKTNDNNVIRERTSYAYNANNPFLPSTISSYPNEENTLGTSTTYNYNNFGLITQENTNSLVGTLTTSKRYLYSTDGRFLETESTVTSDCGTYTKEFEYNTYYGHLRKASDYNSFSTYTSNSDRMGITVFSCDLDPQGHGIGGSSLNHAVRWLEGSGYERFGYYLPEAVYFTWQKQQGKAESLVIYDAAGRELRSVSFGLTLNDTIFVDTKYDNQGRVSEVTDPYFADDGPLSVGKTTYEYDNYDRPAMTIVYDKNGDALFHTKRNYFGLETTTTVCRSNSNKEKFVDHVNIMGWKDAHLDLLDPDDVVNPANRVLVQYDYYADGKLAWAKTTSNGNQSNDDTKVTMQYDALGNRIQLVDPDYGTVNSLYDAFGQLRWTVSPKGDTTAYEYDGLGRTIARTEIDHNDNTRVMTHWYYNDDAGRKGLLDSICHDGGNQVVRYAYDTLNRIVQVTETLDNRSYATNYEYDGYSRLKTTEYPSHYVTRNEYSPTTGVLTAIKDENWHTLWALNGMNPMGQITEFQTGDGTITNRGYDDMHRLETQLATNGNNIIQDFAYDYDDFSNLAARTENKYALPMTESFTYDRLNRLDSIKFNNVASVMTYDPHGRILSKQAEGQTVFSGAQYATYDQHGRLKPHAISSATVPNGSALTSRLDAQYTTFDKVKSLTKYDANNNVERTLAYTYGYDHQRIRMVETANGNPYRAKTYVGSCEYNHDPDCERTLTYLSAPTGVFAVHVTEGTNYLTNTDQVLERLLYLHKDHLGSITTITDASGTIQQELSFDAWGNLRNPTTWSGSFTGTPLIDRGFTGHEHLYGFGLINMNGRMYDPVMSSFLSVDNYVQDPENSQNFNRYAYCLNNPLIYVDPNGEEFLTTAIIIGGVLIGAYFGGALANHGNYNPVQWEWKNPGTIVGVVGGGIVGGCSAAAGFFIAGAGFAFCNTTSIAASSLIYSGGMYVTGLGAGFDYDISISLGAVSYNFTKGEWGYLFKKGNSVWDNIGYGLGGLTNACDIYRFATWDVLSKEKKLEIIKQTIDDKEVEISYDKNLNMDGQYNKNTNEITIGRKGLRKGRGWAQSTLQHEDKHHLDIISGLGNKDNTFLDWRAYVEELRNAEQNGLTIQQHYELVKRATDCAINQGQSIGKLPNYTLKEWLRSILYWY